MADAKNGWYRNIGYYLISIQYAALNHKGPVLGQIFGQIKIFNQKKLFFSYLLTTRWHCAEIVHVPSS